MRLKNIICVAGGALAISTIGFCNVSFAQSVPGNWTQTWADEFNTGSSDLSTWTHELGGGGWGNNELETYTSNSSNSSVSTAAGVGALHIDAVATTSGSKTTYTSARIKTASAFSQAYGVFEFRAKFAAGQGLWPAMWMMPQGSSYGSWPNSGEIDVFESKGQTPSLVQGSLHSGTDSASQDTQTGKFSDSGKVPVGFTTTDWHTYDLEWDAGTGGKASTVSWFVDGIKYETHTGGWVVPSGGSAAAPFDKPFYLILNMAVGGDYAGTPSLTAGTYDMQVDYVRAFSAAVPEPTSMMMLAVGAVAMKRRRR